MTISLSLDDDVAAALADEAERRGVPAEQLANEELRAKFCQKQSESRKPFVIKTFSSAYQPGIDPTRLKDYLYQEDDERLRRVSQHPAE
jgi:hypothetical protein